MASRKPLYSSGAIGAVLQLGRELVEDLDLRWFRLAAVMAGGTVKGFLHHLHHEIADALAVKEGCRAAVVMHDQEG
jgi:hypothetical protein